MAGMLARSAVEDEVFGLNSEKCSSESSPHEHTQARLLRGGPVVTKIASWCLKHNQRRHGQKATLAVIYFDTGADADEYLFIKAIVAARAGVGYEEYKLSPHAPIEDVLAQITELNDDDRIHGVLIQRPIPKHLCETQVMASVVPIKHIEEFSVEKSNNIAYDGLYRLLRSYGRAWMLDLDVVLLGGTNIITPGFRSQLRRQHKHVGALQTLDPIPQGSKYDTIIITELNRGGIIKPHMLGPSVRLVVDLGFDVKSKVGDLDPEVLDMDDLEVVPTPHGVLPVLLWTMMERTIKARDHLVRPRLHCLPDCVML
ncbi:putative tetrahydrofolate dehydrogenase/cyclohydrolase [Septoria linicola]|nr:putative tetrahydrofolate dehydrogenase/cyclohydrolase [Septoria linicola]